MVRVKVKSAQALNCFIFPSAQTYMLVFSNVAEHHTAPKYKEKHMNQRIKVVPNRSKKSNVLDVDLDLAGFKW